MTLNEKIVEMIVREGYKRYENAGASDKDLVRKIYAVWMEVGMELNKVLKDSQENKNG